MTDYWLIIGNSVSFTGINSCVVYDDIMIYDALSYDNKPTEFELESLTDVALATNSPTIGP